MPAQRWILLTVAACTMLACSLWLVPSPAEDASQNASPDAEDHVAATQALLKDFIKSRDDGDFTNNPKLLMQRARQVGEQARKAYPYQSLRSRLEYETRRAPRASELNLSTEAEERLQRHDMRMAPLAAGGGFDRFRAKSLETLHSEQVAQFIARDGFGRARLPSPTSPLYWELPEARTIPLAATPHRAVSRAADEIQSLPKDLARHDILRLHAGEPTWTDAQIDDKYYNKMSHDERMKALFDTYKAWQAKHNPLHLPSRKLILDSHDSAVFDFAGSGRNGHVKDLDHVAGFGSHAMIRSPQFEPGPTELRYWPDPRKEAPLQWLVTQLQLVSLLKHDAPGVYASKNLPRMEELTETELRPLNDFESASLERLAAGDDLALEVHTDRIRMLGALRASKQCVQCHQVTHGELLGAFSYELVRADETDRAE